MQKGFNDLVQLYLRRVDLKYPFRECGNLIGRNFWQLNPACLQWFSSTYSDEGGFKISVSRMAQSDWSKFLAIKSGLKGISVNLYVIYLYVSAWDTPWISRLGQFLGIMRIMFPMRLEWRLLKLKNYPSAIIMCHFVKLNSFLLHCHVIESFFALYKTACLFDF